MGHYLEGSAVISDPDDTDLESQSDKGLEEDLG